MNILDDNSENVLLQKTPFGKILLIGIGIPIGLTFLIFQYLFDGNFNLRPVFFSFGRNSTPISIFSVLSLFLCVLIFFNLSSIWVRNIICSKTLRITLQTLVLILIVTLMFFAVYGELIEGGWTVYPPLSALPLSDSVPKISLNTRFQNLMFAVPLVGIFSLWDISKNYLKK